MNLTQLNASVAAKGYSFTQAADDPTNPILAALNSVYRQVCGSQRWPFLEKTVTLGSTTAGTASYPLSSLSDFRQLDAVRLINSVDLTPYDIQNKEPQDLRSIALGDTSTAVPAYWTQYAGNIQFWPVPDSVYAIVVDYIISPADLAAVSDVPVLPAVYHDVLVWGAVHELAFRERDWIGRGDANNTFQMRYKAMQEEYELMQRQTSSRVKRSGFNNTADYYGLLPGIGN